MGGSDATIPETPRAAAARPGRTEVALPSRYRILDVIGEGGMGRVFRAHDATLGRDVAIKIIEGDLPGPDKTIQRERFVREARAAARLIHPNIVAVHDVDPDAGWLVMELVEGESLRQLAQRGPVSPKLAHAIAEQVLAGLAAAHANGVIHRDIKPSNIILGSDGKVTIVDFGVARLTDAEITKTGDYLGTPAYMAPEQVRGAPVDARTDLYGLGVTLYELVTGSRLVAFESPSALALERVVEACTPDHGLARLIIRCLQAEPDARFASAQVALAALADRRPLRPSPWKKIALLAALTVVAGGLTALVITLVRPDAKADPRVTNAFLHAQRGEHERASGLLEDYLAGHPNDPDALTLQFLTTWWSNGSIDAKDRTLAAPLRPSQRALVHGITLITQRRESEATAYLARADRDHPNQPEILYALGEAQWHGHQVAEGAATLERAFFLDPRWQVALHHVVELRLASGQAALLRPISDRLRPTDPAAAAVLACKVALAERRYADATTRAQAALASHDSIPELHVCQAQAQILAGDLESATATAKRAFDLWPIDLREVGGFAQYAETLLYRGQLDEYLALLGNKPSGQRSLAQLLWRMPAEPFVTTTPDGMGMRMPPLGAATWVLSMAKAGKDGSSVYADYPELEVRGYGNGLAAELRGDPRAAIAHYREALTVPAKGDLRMPLAHHLARALTTAGDAQGAAAACDEVIAPRSYQTYRALVIPDCLLWSGDPKRWQQLVDAWRGSFAHPAVVEARRRLGR